MAYTPVRLNNNEVDIPVGADEIVEFVVNTDEIVLVQNAHPFEAVFFQVSNDITRKPFILKAGDYTKIEKTMFFRTSVSGTENVVLATDRV